MNEILPLKLEETIWVLSSHTGTKTYDFAFESYFQCRRRWNPDERVCAIGRFGAAEEYEREYHNLKNIGIELIHSVEEHKRCSTLSGWYPLLMDITPKSIVYEQHPTAGEIDAQFNWPVFMKGERQSSRHNRDLCIIENERHFKEALSHYSNDPFLNWQRMTIREFLPLRLVGSQSPHSLPRAFEFRTFWWKKECVGIGQYWLGDTYSPTNEDLEAIHGIARIAALRVDVAFLVVDVAQTITGRWIVIECNDAQESGYAGVSPLTLWRKLIDVERESES